MPKPASIPIVMLTAKGEETDVVSVWSVPVADDIRHETFQHEKCFGRVSSVLRRTMPINHRPERRRILKGRPLISIRCNMEVAVIRRIKLTLTDSNFCRLWSSAREEF